MDPETDSKWTPKQAQAIELLVLGLSMEAVASQVSVSSRTIRNWKRDKAFATEVREKLTDLREAIQARFNPAIQRIQALTDQFLDRLEKMMGSTDERTQFRAMQLHLQCLKWAGGKDNAYRGSDMCLDGMIGPRTGYIDMLSAKTRQFDQLWKSMGRPAPATPDTEPMYDDPETAGVRGQGTSASSVESPGVSTEAQHEAAAESFPIADESGKNRKPCEPAAPAPLPVNGEGLGVGSGNAGPAPIAPEPEKSGNAPASATLSDAEKTGNEQALSASAPAPHKKPWREKGSNHVPFYKKFQRR